MSGTDLIEWTLRNSVSGRDAVGLGVEHPLVDLMVEHAVAVRLGHDGVLVEQAGQHAGRVEGGVAQEPADIGGM